MKSASLLNADEAFQKQLRELHVVDGECINDKHNFEDKFSVPSLHSPTDRTQPFMSARCIQEIEEEIEM